LKRTIMTLIHTGILLAVLGLAACGGGSGLSQATCADFRYQEDAQASFSSNKAQRMDIDNDGVACEELPSRAAASNPPPSVPPVASPPASSPAPALPNPPPSPTPAPAPTPVTSSQIIEYYGDSTIWGYQTYSGTQVETTAPEAFAAALPTSPIRYAVVNEGVSGSNACQLRDGTDGTHPDWITQMASSQASVVVINHAINHIGTDIEAYKACLRSLAQGATARGKRVLFETPNPITSGGLGDYVQAMKDIAAQQNIPVIDQYQYLMEQFNGDASRIAPDGLHPTEEVYVMKGRYAASVFVGQ
jgi:lysophospholipase L1-like esterase